jgi:hypothetical protein
LQNVKGRKWPSKGFHKALVLRRPQARWKWRRKPLERLVLAMKMARSETGGLESRNCGIEANDATVFGA